MLARFFKERMGGDRFFKELERAKQNPAVNLGVLEIMHACLSLGFEGVYRASGGPGAAQGIRRDLYETICRAQSKTIEDLSPHWRGQDVPLSGNRLQVPVWAVAALAAVVLLGSYLYLRNALSARAETLALKMAEIHPAGELTIARETIVKPPPDPKPRTSTQLERIRAALAKEIVAGKVVADQSATTIFIRIGNVVLFPSGGAKVSDSFAPIAAKIAAALDREPGADSCRRLHRRGSDSHCRLSLELRALRGARQVGREHVEARPCACRTARGDGEGSRQSDRCKRHGVQQVEKPARRSFHPESGLRVWLRCAQGSAIDDFDGLALDRSEHSRRLIVLAAVVWLAGPLVSIGDVQPCTTARSSGLSSFCDLPAAVAAHRLAHHSRRRAAAKIAVDDETVAEGSDAPVLKQRDGGRSLAVLKRSGKSNAARPLRPSLVSHHRAAGRRQDERRLSNSGSSFRSLATTRPWPCRASGVRDIVDTGGSPTKPCSSDTAGRYTTQDRTRRLIAAAGSPSSTCLAGNAPCSRSTGSSVAISIAMFSVFRRKGWRRMPMRSASVLDAAIARGTEGRLPRLRHLLTKMDSRGGLHPIFRRPGGDEATGGLGATFDAIRQEGQQRRQGSRGNRSASFGPSQRECPNGCRSEPDLRSRAILFGFPAQLGAIRKPIADFLNRAFEPTRYQTTAILRGFYFTSGTQEGTPFDAVIGALQKELRRAEPRQRRIFRRGAEASSWRDLLTKVIFGEAGWVSTDWPRAPIAGAQSRGVRTDRPRDRRHSRLVVDELHAKRSADYRDRSGRR